MSEEFVSEEFVSEDYGVSERARQFAALYAEDRIGDQFR